MPGYDGTGPSGQGGRTGRGVGRCPPAETIATEEGAVTAGVQENLPFAAADQTGMGRGFGMGRGRGCGRGAGMGRGCGRGFGRR